MKNDSVTALYIRLSREDESNCESESVENQRLLLRCFAAGKKGFDNIREYIDDGFSGTTFNRPSFSRMLADIEKGEIGCVLVKDLSRLGRDYIETGYYLERYFPLKSVRFIAVNDMVDTALDSGMGNTSLIISFKNLINDEYARDISVKVKTALRAKKQKGFFACPFASYGFDKDEHGKLHVNKCESDIVKFIYGLKKNRNGTKDIAQKLNFLAIMPPGKEKQQKTGYKNPSISDQWTYQSVYRILNNKIYSGDLVMCKSETISHKIKKRRATNKDRQIIIKNAVETIVKDFKNDFSPNIICGGCGAKMNRKKGSKYEYLVCSQYKKSGADSCESHYICIDKLNKIINKIFVVCFLMYICHLFYGCQINERCDEYTNLNYNPLIAPVKIRILSAKKIEVYFGNI